MLMNICKILHVPSWNVALECISIEVKSVVETMQNKNFVHVFIAKHK